MGAGGEELKRGEKNKNFLKILFCGLWNKKMVSLKIATGQLTFSTVIWLIFEGQDISS